jgi:MSHA biogenesis protein MshO
VSGPITYRCAPAGPNANGDGTGRLERMSGYAITLAQPQPALGTGAMLALYVTACDIQYNQLVLTQNHGIVSIQLSITRGGETVSLYHEVHVSNVP